MSHTHFQLESGTGMKENERVMNSHTLPVGTIFFSPKEEAV
jgi:hypothetical protein